MLIRELEQQLGFRLFNRTTRRVAVPPEYAAGAPIQPDAVKCKLKPIDMADYAVPFSAQQLERLMAIFPDGVCDWSKRGHQQVNGLPWASFGPSPVNQVFDLLHRRRNDD